MLEAYQPPTSGTEMDTTGGATSTGAGDARSGSTSGQQDDPMVIDKPQSTETHAKSSDPQLTKHFINQSPDEDAKMPDAESESQSDDTRAG